EAYRLSSDAKILPKLAAVLRRTGDCQQAGALYAEYLDKVKNPPDQAEISASVDEAKYCQKKPGYNNDDIHKHYTDGATHYQLEEYDQAIVEFKEAYRLSQDPNYLFNIAQAYRLSKNCGEAKMYYKKYLTAVPAAEDKEKIEQKI